jgi:hypothetical protein
MELRLFVLDGAEFARSVQTATYADSVVATATKGWYAQTAEACKPRVSHVHAIGQSECFTQSAAVLHGMSRQNLPMCIFTCILC